MLHSVSDKAECLGLSRHHRGHKARERQPHRGHRLGLRADAGLHRGHQLGLMPDLIKALETTESVYGRLGLDVAAAYSHCLDVIKNVPLLD